LELSLLQDSVVAAQNNLHIREAHEKYNNVGAETCQANVHRKACGRLRGVAQKTISLM
jgi:hypothetical protein